MNVSVPFSPGLWRHSFSPAMISYPSLQSLPYPVYFVRNDPELCKSLADVTTMPPFEQFYRPSAGGSSSWIVQTYLQLKCRGLNVHLVPQLLPGQICVVAREELLKLIKRNPFKAVPFRSYLVVCQQDRPRPEICEQRIVQNTMNVLGPTDHFLPHWPQPDLRSRNPDRGNRVENLVFKGRWYYMPEPFKSSGFVEKLNALGFNFSVGSDHAVSLEDWQDYSDADVLLAIRPPRTDQLLTAKPPTKLINAWMAGCPALLGPEPAFQALRQSELDYIEVNTPADVIDALQLLRSNPGLYQAMIENGQQRAREFVPEHIAKLWHKVLSGPIADGYVQWLQRDIAQKMIGSPLQFFHRLFIQRQEFQRFYNQHEQSVKSVN